MIAPLCCVIPALDAAGTLTGTVAGVRRALPGAVVIVVDDGSRDATREIGRRIADLVISFDSNRGKGQALRAGFAAAVERGAAAVLTIDADGQHDPGHAPALMRALEHADLVVGARERSGTRMPIHRRLSNALSSAAINACAGTRLPDTQSGYRAIRGEVLRTITPVGDRYEFETDFLIRAARAGFRVVGVPVSTIYGAPSHFHLVRDAARVLRTIWRHRAGAFQ
jgi:glycosyltransferase involved in cell wall biosynthesis